MDQLDAGVTAASNEVQTLNDIQSYLATFNKEIGGTNIVTSLSGEQLLIQGGGEMQMGDGVLNVQNNGNQGTGLQAGTSAQLESIDNASLANQSGQFMQSLQSQDLARIIQQASTGADSNQQDSLTLNTGNTYQTVTIVPTTEVNQSGEVSYVLIVSPPDEDKNQTQQDLSVFDFKEEKAIDIECEKDEDNDADGLAAMGGMTSSRLGSAASTSAARRGGMPQQMQQLMCNYCNYTSSKRYLLTRHMRTHSEERPHKCNICDRGFKTVGSLQNHINTHTGVKPHKCKECDSTFTTSGELVRHVRYRHTFEKPHKCTFCDYASVELSKLKRHLRSHSGERPYKCPHCSYSSPDTFKLKRHLRIHTGEKPYECDICHARFTQSNSLKAHRQIHTGDKPVYQCELCPTTCGRKTDLKIHVQKLHTSDKPLQCKKCGKAFPDRYTYKIHLKTHDGEKCFKCELCPYAALSQRHLESHILTHTGEKPFQCEHCEMSFRQKQLLKRHVNIYHTLEYAPPVPKPKKNSCVECGKSFAHRGNLLRHMLQHDPDNPLYQEMALKADAEEMNNPMEGIEENEEEEGEGIAEGEMSDSDVTSANTNQMQVQLVNMNEGDESAENIYVQHEGVMYSLQLPDHSHPDGTIPVGEPNTGNNSQDERGVIKVEEGVPENRITYSGVTMRSSKVAIDEGVFIPGTSQQAHITISNMASSQQLVTSTDTAAANAFGFDAVEEDCIAPGEH